jgi:hypothetical protein
MKQILSFFLILLALVACQKDSSIALVVPVAPIVPIPSQGASLLRKMQATYTSIQYNGSRQVINRTLTFTFDKLCQPIERYDSYAENGQEYAFNKNRYFYDQRGYLQEDAQYEVLPQFIFLYGYQKTQRRLFYYDKQDRLNSIRQQCIPGRTNVCSGRPDQITTYEYLDQTNQINQYSCGSDSARCSFQTTYINGVRTPPLYDPNKATYTNSYPNPYGNIVYELYDTKSGNILSAKAVGLYNQTAIIAQRDYEYDNKPTPLIDIPSYFFKGFPQLKSGQSPNNCTRTIYRAFDNTGKITEEIEGIYTYQYNILGYPTQMNFLEINNITGKETGNKTTITFIYTCPQLNPISPLPQRVGSL